MTIAPRRPVDLASLVRDVGDSEIEGPTATECVESGFSCPAPGGKGPIPSEQTNVTIDCQD